MGKLRKATPLVYGYAVRKDNQDSNLLWNLLLRAP